MRRSVLVMLVLCLALSTSAVTARPRPEKNRRTERVEVVQYQQPIVGRSPTGMCIDCPTIITGPRERFLTAEIDDAVSPTGYIELWINPMMPEEPIEYHATICGAIDSPIAVPPNTIFLLRVWAVPSDNCTGTSTTGSVTFTFSNRK